MNAKHYFEFKVIAEKMRKFKDDKGLTFDEFGKGLAINKSHIHRVVNMESYPSFQFLVLLARFMKVPLYSLFIPSSEVIQQDFLEKIRERVEEMDLTLETVAEGTGIKHFRLMDILEGSKATTRERESIFTFLQIKPECEDSKEFKMNLLKNLLNDLGLKETQTKNIVTYVEENIEK